jgi:hypothetical protein
MNRKVPVAIIGPADLVERACSVAAEFSALETLPYPYDHESETVSLVVASRETAGALLFTGVLPYRMADRAGVLDRPATYIGYTGASLHLALLQLMLEGEQVGRFSIDTLARHQVDEALQEAGLPTDDVVVFDYDYPVQDDKIVRFHQEAHAKHGTTIAISCVRSVYEALSEDFGDEVRTVRLHPARSSIRFALENLLSDSRRRDTQDAQIALGIIEFTPGGTDGDGPGRTALLHRHSASLGGSVIPRGDGSHLMITTRGVLHDATGGFRSLPMLQDLSADHPQVRVGFGIGRSGADAEVLARAALRRARSVDDVAAAVAFNAHTIVQMSASRDVAPSSLPQLARRAGMRQETLLKVRQLVETRGTRVLIASDVADFFGVEARAGRRILVKLARSGLAEPVGTRHLGASGRPAIEYHVHL